MMHPLKQLTNKRPTGVYSACTGNELVIKTVLKRAKETHTYALIEATSNQVNQFGGYTGMTPKDYRDFVHAIAKKVGFPESRIILGGDHLGPLIWTDIDPEEAMEKAETLVYDYVLAGFTKIHLDTSMKIKGDGDLSDETIALRSMRLAKAAEKAFNVLKENEPQSILPVFIVGSEVPIPGGSQEEETVTITSPKALDKTYETFKRIFYENGLNEIFENIIGIVVQPGVEFGDEEIVRYDRVKAKSLTDHLKENYEKLVFEGHSTDYQSQKDMREMVEDGIAILKVGPGLTFSLREGLFNLSAIEKAMFLIPNSDFERILDQSMIEKPDNWKKHYHGNEMQVMLKRKFSFSDRSRYYLNEDLINKSMAVLLGNFENIDIPLNLISQFFPRQYLEIINGDLGASALDLLMRHVEYTIDDYLSATHQNELQ